MKSNALLITLLVYGVALAQPQGGIEQYGYIKHNERISINPILHFQSSKNWYVEGRYNYEDYRTYSLYAGKAFSKESNFSYSIVPLLGVVFGKLDGGSMGFNANLEYSKFYLSSQTQCTLIRDPSESFYFSWTEIGIETTKWLYAGVASQHTYMLRNEENWLDLGPVIGFSFGKWTIPIYSLNPFTSNRFFIVGVNWEWGKD